MVAGRVTDPSDAVVSGAVVTATSANGATAETRTNTDGHYLLAPLVIGRYQIAVEAPAFKRAVSDAVDIHAGARVRE